MASAARDRIVRALLGEGARRPSATERAILLLLYWCPLVGLWRTSWWWDEGEPEGVWSALVSAFFTALSEIDREPATGLARRILWRTRDVARNEYRREWRLRDRLDLEPEEGWLRRRGHSEDDDEPTDDEEPGPINLEDMPGVPTLAGTDPGETPLAYGGVLKALKRCLDDGVITKAEHAVLLGSVAHGRTVKDECARLGLRYDTIKKRLQRARPALARRIRGFLA